MLSSQNISEQMTDGFLYEELYEGGSEPPPSSADELKMHEIIDEALNSFNEQILEGRHRDDENLVEKMLKMLKDKKSSTRLRILSS